MRIFTAGVSTETNSFSPQPTDLAAFKEVVLFHGDASAHPSTQEGEMVLLFRALAKRDGDELVEGLFASAEPAGLTLQPVFDGFCDEIVEDLRRHGPFDVVLLPLHGAMMSTGSDDCEGDLLARVRAEVGPDVVIGVELDPHCHLTPRMLGLADAIVVMKNYPHDDYLARAEELFRICRDAAAGRSRPVSAVFDCRMVGFYPTTLEPMAGLVRDLHLAEAAPGVLSASFVHGFAWGDSAHGGSKVLVIADGDPALAEGEAERLGRRIYDQRDALLPRMPTIDEALDRVAALDGLVVLADVADNPGGGAPGDNTALLAALIERRCAGAVLGAIHDPAAASECAAAGVGARLSLTLGGHGGWASGAPLPVDALVRGVRPAHDQRMWGSARSPMGLCVWLEVDGVDVLVQSIRAQIFSPDAFTGLGIGLGGRRLVAVKSSQHFEAGFGPIADHIIRVATPGAIQMDFAALPYVRKIDRGFFPASADSLSPDQRARRVERLPA